MDKFGKRKYIVGAVFVLIGLIYLIRLFSLQVIDSSYKKYATRNVLRKVIKYPARGLIYDRNGKLLVYNKAAYDLLVIPRQVSAFDTTAFCKIVGITKEELITNLQKARHYSRYKPSIIVKQLSPEVYAVLQEQLYKYSGFFVQTRTLRDYPQNIASHVLGYVGEVNQQDIRQDSYYKQGDYIGVTGLEKTYEKDLRGRKGVNYYLVDVHNRIKGSYNEGKNDTAAISGKHLNTTIDSKLQALTEQLMKNKRGAVVAIEPSTGEILTMYSGPTYNPNLLVGRERSKNYLKLLRDTLHPLTNRAIAAAYSPGSTFKTLNALIGLQEQAINMESHWVCHGPESWPIKCTHYHENPVYLTTGIRESCNTFFWHTFKNMMEKYPTSEESFKKWREYMVDFGIGQRLGTEFYGQSRGFLPTTKYYDHIYGRHHWNALTIRSLAIGQGEVIMTPLQMANMATLIANRGYFIDPHLVRSETNEAGQTQQLSYKRHNIPIDTKYYEDVIEGMQQVVDDTGNRYKTHVDGITICGKTGTIQNSEGADHSAFIAFAPRENPKIAVAVYVEFGVWGSRYAAPIASLIIEKYLRDSISSPHRKKIEQEMINANLLSPHQSK